MNPEHTVLLLSILLGYGLMLLVFWLGLRQNGREHRMSLAAFHITMQRWFARRLERSGREFRLLLERMDAHVAMVLERVDRERPGS